MFRDEYGKFQSQQNSSTGNETYPWRITVDYFNNDTFIDLGMSHLHFYFLLFIKINPNEIMFVFILKL